MYIHICIHTSNRVSGSVRDSLGIMRKQGASKVSDVANSESSPFCETPANQNQTPFNPSQCHTEARRVSQYSSALRALRALRALTALRLLRLLSLTIFNKGSMRLSKFNTRLSCGTCPFDHLCTHTECSPTSTECRF